MNLNKLSNIELVEEFYKVLDKINPDYFLEVGAFQAETSCYVSENFPACKVVAYEANPFNYEKFKEQLSKYNFNYINNAISDTNGPVTMYLQNKSFKQNDKFIRGNNSLLKRTSEKKEYTEVTVDCYTLDSLYNIEDKKFVLWIDVEGKGYEVLQGASKLLDNVHAVFIEVEQKQFWKEQKLDTDIISYLKSKGFYIYKQDHEFKMQYNILFLRSNNEGQ